MLARFLLAAVLVVGLSSPLLAQQRHKASQQPAAMQPTEIEGVIEAVVPGGLVVLDKNNLSWQVSVRFAKIHVTGTATADYLQPGQTVEFKAEIDEHGAIMSGVDQLSIITPSEDKSPGLFPAEAAAKAGDDQGGFGVPGADVGNAGGKSAKHTGTATPKGAKASAIAPGTYRIVGRLVVHGNKFSVHAGRRTLSFELGEKPTIAVDFADFSVASKGDKASIKAVKVPSRSNASLAQASEVKIELADLLVGVKKKGTAAKSDSKRTTKHPKKDDEGLPAPAADK